jgi:hypothetical protein
METFHDLLFRVLMRRVMMVTIGIESCHMRKVKRLVHKSREAHILGVWVC